MYKRPLPRVTPVGPVPHVDIKPTILTEILSTMNDPPPPITHYPSTYYVNVRPIKPKPVFIRKLEPVSVNMRITEDHVHVYIDTLSWKIYTKYLSKGKKPPLGEYIRSLEAAGCTEQMIHKVIREYQWWEENDEMMQREIERLWPSSKTKKPVQVEKKVLKAVKKA